MFQDCLRGEGHRSQMPSFARWSPRTVGLIEELKSRVDRQFTNTWLPYPLNGRIERFTFLPAFS